MKKFKAVCFDNGGVISGDSGAGHEFNLEISQLLGITVDEYRQLYFSMNHLVNTGEVQSWEDFWPLFLERVNQQDKLESALAIMRKYAKRYKTINQEVLNLIDSLRKNGYKTGLLSNATKSAGEEFRQQGLNINFDAFHVSGETGLQKPDPKAFENIARDLGVELSELIFIDDTEKSLSTADICGYTPILFRTYSELIKDLDKLGITY